jgi:acetylornithine deacetylase/succinyl-diaminopimelate desuccinylase-like protein
MRFEYSAQHMTFRFAVWFGLMALFVIESASAQPANPSGVEDETLRHFQALLRLDTSNPPGNEVLAVEYLKQVLEKEGIPVQVFASDAKRPNLVARLKGNGKERPILVMGHTDVVGVDPKKWTHPPFGAVREGGYVYGRGAVDDKDNVAAGLMLMLMLKRNNVTLDRDVIFLAESGEEGTPQVGAQFMIDNHLDAINAEFCLAEGGGVVRTGGKVVRANVGTTEKEPRAIELIARGPAGHGSVPRRENAVARLTGAVSKIVAWTPPLRVTETTGSYFRMLASMASAPEAAQRYRDLINPDPNVHRPAAEWMLDNEPQHWAMMHSSLVPTIIDGGFRYNVIPSEARATIDLRLHPDEDHDQFLEQLRKVVNDSNVEVRYARERYRPAGASSLTTEAFSVIEEQIKKHYGTFVLPTMGTGATDMAQIRSKGIQCYGVGPAIDSEDAGKGFGAHSDQERILESELHRFVRFQYDVVVALAAAK